MSKANLQGAERRRHFRLEHNVPVKISSADLDIVTETSNLSCSGAFCRINKFIAPMTKLKLNLLLPIRKNNKIVTKHVHCEGVVVRAESVSTDDYFETAIFFSDITPKDAQVIHDFVDSIVKEKTST